MNVQGTKSLLEIAQGMKKIEAVIHVSTAYAHCYQDKTEEALYMSENSPDADDIIDMCQRVPSEELNSAQTTNTIIGNHPNTYTFTKALAEGMLAKTSKDLPVAIVRPSIVVAAWKDPCPGKKRPGSESFLESYLVEGPDLQKKKVECHCSPRLIWCILGQKGPM